MHIQFLEDICTISVLSLLTCMESVPTYSIPGGYVHKFFGVLIHKEVLGERSSRENNLLRSVLVNHGGVFLVTQTYGEVF